MSTASGTRLPLELLESIVDESSDDIRSLQVLVLTCRALLPRSRSHLFIRIVISTKAQVDSIGDFLDGRTWLGRLVRYIRICQTTGDDHHFLSIFPSILFSRLPKIIGLELTNSNQALWKNPSIKFHRATLTALDGTTVTA